MNVKLKLKKVNFLKDKKYICLTHSCLKFIKLTKQDVKNFFKYHNFEIPSFKNIKLVNRYKKGRFAYVRCDNPPWENSVGK